MAHINSLLSDFNETGNYSSLEEAIQLFESNTSGLLLNVEEGTGTIDVLQNVDNRRFNEIFNPDVINDTLSNIIANNPTESEKIALLNILQKVANNYTRSEEYGADGVLPKTHSLLEIQKYIDILKGEN